MQDAPNKPWLMLECLVEFSYMALNNSVLVDELPSDGAYVSFCYSVRFDNLQLRLAFLWLIRLFLHARYLLRTHVFAKLSSLYICCQSKLMLCSSC